MLKKKRLHEKNLMEENQTEMDSMKSKHEHFRWETSLQPTSSIIFPPSLLVRLSVTYATQKAPAVPFLSWPFDFLIPCSSPRPVEN